MIISDHFPVCFATAVATVSAHTESTPRTTFSTGGSFGYDACRQQAQREQAEKKKSQPKLSTTELANNKSGGFWAEGVLVKRREERPKKRPQYNGKSGSNDATFVFVVVEMIEQRRAIPNRTHDHQDLLPRP